MAVREFERPRDKYHGSKEQDAFIVQQVKSNSLLEGCNAWEKVISRMWDRS